jgi:hypothetical protein
MSSISKKMIGIMHYAVYANELLQTKKKKEEEL